MWCVYGKTQQQPTVLPSWALTKNSGRKRRTASNTHTYWRYDHHQQQQQSGVNGIVPPKNTYCLNSSGCTLCRSRVSTCFQSKSSARDPQNCCICFRVCICVLCNEGCFSLRFSRSSLTYLLVRWILCLRGRASSHKLIATTTFLVVSPFQLLFVCVIISQLFRPKIRTTTSKRKYVISFLWNVALAASFASDQELTGQGDNLLCSVRLFVRILYNTCFWQDMLSYVCN